MSPYAADTSVTVARSRDEIERTLTRYGAGSFGYAFTPDTAMIAFVVHDRQVRFILPMPDRQSREFLYTKERRFKRTAAEAEKVYDQAVRSRWRSLALIVKAKLEAVTAGVVTFEEEFAMQMVLPDGRRVVEHVLPAIEQAYGTGAVPPLLGIRREP